jgi:NAD(P)-dependent dehydrogenase (short-subunit alcohol dehydrogenase family)
MIANLELGDRRIIVTGAGRGIGRAIALRLAGAGARLVLIGRDVARLAEVPREIETVKGPVAYPLKLDITRSDEIPQAIASCVERLGGIDGLVNNAGANDPMKLFQDLTTAEFRDMVELNLLAQVAITAEVLPHMVGASRGAIVNVASMAGKIGVPGWSAYCAAKHGLLGFTKALSKEVALQGVRVNAVCPGFVRTDLTSDDNMSAWGESLGMSRRVVVRELVYKQTPQRKFVDASSVAAAVHFLLSDDASDITGQSLNVSSGIGDY